MGARQRGNVRAVEPINNQRCRADAFRCEFKYERRLRLDQKTADRAVVDRCTDGAAVLMAMSGDHGSVMVVVMTAMAMAVRVHIIVRMGMRRANGANTAWAIVLAGPNAVEAVA